MKTSKKMLFTAILFVFSLALSSQTTAVHHYLPILTEKQVNDYKGYDMIIVDPEVINTSAKMLISMRQANPDLIILAYSNKIEWHDPMFNDKPWSLKMVSELEKYPKWFLRDLSGQKMEFWSGTVLMNCRLDCPRYEINGKSYNYVEFFTERYIRDIIGAYKRAGIKLDGILDDELFKAISFIGNYGRNKNGVDTNGDKQNDDPSEFDRQWRLGNAYFLNAVREAMGSKFIITGNGGHGFYMKWCDGKMFEYFPEIYLNEADKRLEAWPENMRNASGMKISIFNARANAYGQRDNWFFTLCSTMLIDNVVFSHGQNQPYNSKYNLHLGKALGTYYGENDLYRRKFQNGTVVVDPFTKMARIEK